MNNLSVEHAIVAYFDILGTSEKIKDAGKDKIKLNQVLKDYQFNILGTILTLNNEIVGKKFEYQIFSDSFLIHWLVDEDKISLGKEIGGILELIAQIQNQLALAGVFLRGAIDYDYSFCKNGIIFSPALLKAHETENTIAVVPRIVICETAYNLYYNSFKEFFHTKDHDLNIFKYILKDNDNIYFINYLVDLLKLESTPSLDLLKAIEKHKKIVEENLNKYDDNLHLLEKYRWVANYHNWFCKTEVPDNPELLIDYSANNPEFIFDFLINN